MSNQQRTGVQPVDEVLALVEDAAERPLDEQVQVFERAHAELRRALDPSHASTDPA